MHKMVRNSLPNLLTQEMVPMLLRLEVVHDLCNLKLLIRVKKKAQRNQFWRFAEANKKVEQDRDVWDVFKKVQVNIPLIEVIRQSPRYAKCVKELCTNKHKLTGNEVMSVGENASAYLKRKLPPKLKDPGSFTIPCTIGKTRFTKAMLDLGASINVMPTSIYDALNLGPLKKTSIVIQLADRSNVYSKGIVEDVLVQVKGLIFPVDFYVLDMSDVNSSSSTPLLLGIPFLSTARMKIDVHNGTLTMEFDEEVIHFNIFEARKHPSNIQSDFHNVLETG
ncbi:uncharacterized protein LOC113319194 [Papaver somniferum]|uniref:uncharacterized protein LOC113319194 n=1 Tax=Papaver somniferum TaxID=3469 RepID=UPI000E6F95CF|nr:uncharacterized protein LOC113319194 [Papaver somniferum]